MQLMGGEWSNLSQSDKESDILGSNFLARFLAK